MGSTSTSTLEEAIALVAQHGGNVSNAAMASGVPRSTLQSRMIAAATRGMLGTRPVLPGYELKRTTSKVGPGGEVEQEWVTQTQAPGDPFSLPDGHAVKGISALVGADGRIVQQWIKTREELSATDVVAAAKAAMEDYASPHPPSHPPAVVKDALLTLFPANDWHIGMMSWGRETGVDWDLSIAEKRISEAVADVVSRSPPSGKAVVLVGGDLLHSDNDMNTTARSGNALDVDGRNQKILEVACRMVVRTIDLHLMKHGHVTVRVLKGNHDESTSVAVAYFLLAWYRNEPRITVDVDPSLFFWHRFGSVLLGATHGHTVKISQMPSIMAHRQAANWGETKYRYVHGFHMHHAAKYATEGSGVISEVHQAPIPQDAWHYGSGFISGRSVQTITYHKDLGEVGRVRVAISDQ